MKQVITFQTGSYNSSHLNKLDAQINKFIAEKGVEVIDVKYSTSICSDGAGRVCCFASAMLIYNSKE